MFHGRVVCAPGSADCLAERLAADPGVRNLVVLPGAARCPAGDSVQFELLTASANRVLQQLRTLPASDPVLAGLFALTLGFAVASAATLAFGLAYAQWRTSSTHRTCSPSWWLCWLAWWASFR